MRVFMTGATGYVGGAVATRLIERGHDVAALVRPQTDSKSLRDPLGRSLPGARQAMTTENPVYTIWLTLPHHLLPMPAPELADRAVFFHPRRLRKQPVAGRHLRGWPLGIR